MENIEQLNTSDNLVITKIPKQKKALILRVGGVGDSVILTVVAKELHKRGLIVDFFAGSPVGSVHELFENLPFINSCKQVVRVNNVDSVKDDNGHFIAVNILKDSYDEVYDYKNSIENNSSGLNSREGWRNTLNSNYINWIDLSLAWANIDYTLVDDKNPSIGYKVPEKYEEWYKSLGLSLKNERQNHRIIGIQLSASSLVRTFYRANDLPDLIYAKYPNDIVLVFDQNAWYALNKFGKRKIEFDSELNPLIQSIEIVKNLDVFISADSGFSHIASAIGTKTVTLYTTVPSWTRAKYYADSISIDATAPCHPCFTLEGVCPLRKKEAWDGLTERERDLIELSNKGVNIFDVAKKYQSIPNAINEEFRSATQKLSALSAKMPACVESISIDMLMEKIAQVIQ